MADSSFDIVSKIDRQEVDNALGQTAREIATRFDFKGTGATIEWQGEQAIEITASADDRATAVLDVSTAVTVPSLLGRSVGSARTTLDSLGLTIDVRQVVDTDGSLVISQSPGAGSRVEPDSEVMVVSLP